MQEQPPETRGVGAECGGQRSDEGREEAIQAAAL